MRHSQARSAARHLPRARLWMVVVLASSALALSAAVSSATSLLGPSVRVLPPVGAGATPLATLSGVSCWSSAICTAVGGYYDKSLNGLPMAASGSTAAWSRAVAIALPKNHATSSSASELNAVTCTGPTTCVAVGSYEDTTPSLLPMIATESASKWGPAARVTLPAQAGKNQQQLSRLTSVSCTAVGSCVAVGSFSDKRSVPRIMEVTETGGTWGAAMELSLPSTTGTAQRALGNVELSGVSCTSATSCVAVGSYLNRAGAIVPMRITEAAGVWGTAVAANMPAGTRAVTSSELFAVSCPATGTCVAVGYYTDAAGRISPMIDVETTGTWGPILPIHLPAMTPAATGGSLLGVACRAATTCTVVGSLTLSNGVSVPDVLVEATGWQPIQRVASIPPGIARPRTAVLHGVACPGLNACVGVGSAYQVSPQGTVRDAAAVATPITPTRAIVDPAPPSIVSAAPRPGSIDVTWRAGSDGGSAITSFTATATPGLKTCTSATTSCSINGLANGTGYTVSVTATNSHGTSLPSAPSASVVPGTAPTAPTGVAAALAHTKATVTWHASIGSPGDPVLRYLATATSPLRSTRTCSATTTSCTLTALVAGATYHVTVVAQNAVGISAPSAPRSFRAT